MNRLDEFATLAPDWDSYGAEPINPAAITAARKLLARFPGGFPVPLSDGGVQVEWNLPEGGGLEVECEPDGVTFDYFSWTTSRTTQEADGLGETEINELCARMLG